MEQLLKILILLYLKSCARNAPRQYGTPINRHKPFSGWIHAAGSWAPHKPSSVSKLWGLPLLAGWGRKGKDELYVLKLSLKCKMDFGRWKHLCMKMDHSIQLLEKENWSKSLNIFVCTSIFRKRLNRTLWCTQHILKHSLLLIARICHRFCINTNHFKNCIPQTHHHGLCPWGQGDNGCYASVADGDL